jgi:hypothetical protein
MTDQAEQSRVEAQQLLDDSYTEGAPRDRLVFQALVHALLSLSYELSWHRPKR